MEPPRFISLARACELLGVSSSQGYALVRGGEIPAIQVGGRGIWRIEVRELEAYIQRQYAATRSKIAQDDSSQVDSTQVDSTQVDSTRGDRSRPVSGG
ncbi:helix-turn-helix domain-containing protein [Pengzhenrongella sicca]|uniref:Helix-turn-helix domain-containing protein n=1 Tax=Pengzhenrongella sicca TaxID=2819238 RepID=A0A8A4ZM18_9MICO|nr:helix-turn-helix domain-containing protein [Pengzhenrongella sicca]